MKKYSIGVIFEWFVRVLGWALSLAFLYMLTWPFINGGEGDVSFVVAIYAFVFPLPPAIVCLLIARGMRLFRKYKKDKIQENVEV